MSWEGLMPGDVVDVIAPGFKCDKSALNNSLKILKSWGLVPRVPKDLFGKDLLCANTDEVRWRHLKSALTAKDSKAIWCVRGGYGSCRLMPKLQKLKKPKKAKVLIGYSDITTLHQHLNQKWGWTTLHAPLLDTLAEHENMKDFFLLQDILMGLEDEVLVSKLKCISFAKTSRSVIGDLVGGNLSVLHSHLGTPWEESWQGKILFLEDIGERGYRLDKMLFQLESSGAFKGLKAIVLGDFTGGKEPGSSRSLVWPTLERFFSSYKIPVYRGVPAGHGKKKMPLPLGAKCLLVNGELAIKTNVEMPKGLVIA